MSKINMALYERSVTRKSMLREAGVMAIWLALSIHSGLTWWIALAVMWTIAVIVINVVGWRHEAPLRRKVYVGPAVRLIDYGDPFWVPVTVLGPAWTPGLVAYGTPGNEWSYLVKESAVRPAFVAAPVDAR